MPSPVCLQPQKQLYWGTPQIPHAEPSCSVSLMKTPLSWCCSLLWNAHHGVFPPLLQTKESLGERPRSSCCKRWQLIFSFHVFSHQEHLIRKSMILLSVAHNQGCHKGFSNVTYNQPVLGTPCLCSGSIVCYCTHDFFSFSLVKYSVLQTQSAEPPKQDSAKM